jgi:hypothetical protein
MPPRGASEITDTIRSSRTRNGSVFSDTVGEGRKKRGHTKADTPVNALATIRELIVYVPS